MEQTSPVGSRNNPMRKIIIMIGIAITVFLAFTSYSVKKSVESSSQLSTIRDLYFPILERVDANIVRLDKMEENYLNAVMQGEQDMVTQANEVHKRADAVFVEMIKLNPEREGAIRKLREAAQKYKDLATSVAADLVGKTGNDVSARTQDMSKTLEDLRKDIKTFRESSYADFTQTLGDTQHSVKVNMYMGLALGLMNLCFMGVLVYFVRNNVKMIAVIGEQNANLETRVAQRTAELSQKTNDINAMLQNMKLGVCTAVPGNRIHPEYSSYMTTIFDSDQLAGRDVLEALFARTNLGADTLDQVSVALTAIVGEDAMMFDFNGHLLVREMKISGADGATKILQMDWSPILGEGDVVDKVLLIVQDVTHLRALEEAAAHQKAELDMISQIIKISIGKFNDFVASSQKYLEENRRLISQAHSADTETIAALFRNMHTIKGNARTFELNLITDFAHIAEQEYDRLRKDPTVDWNPEQLLAELGAVEDAVNRYVEVNESKLGRKGRASDLLTTRGVFISNDEILSLKAQAAELSAGDPQAALARLQASLGQLGLIALERLVSGSVDSLASLAKELDKPTPAVDIVNGAIGFNNQFAEALKSSFMHIVRNSMDHGIESPAERQSAGKPEQGRIRFACERVGDALQLHIGDDGRGLALHKLYAKGLEAGVFGPDQKPSAQDVAEIIFYSGLSTAEQVSMVSGRGVGMDAVRAFLQEHGSQVQIVLDQRDAEFGFTPFKFVITLPQSAYTI